MKFPSLSRLIGLLALVSVSGGFAISAPADRPGPASVEIRLPGRPFDVIASRDAKWVFVSVGRPNALIVLRNQNGVLQPVNRIATAVPAFGLALTRNDDALIVAAGDRVLIYDVHELTHSHVEPSVRSIATDANAGTIMAAVTRDGRTLFVTNEHDRSITVIGLESADGGSAPAVICRIPVGSAPVALAFSKDQRWLFATCEVAAPEWGWPRVLESENNRSGKVPEGAVVVIDVAAARKSPATAVLSKVPAGGSPVRLALSPDGGHLFVTARASNALLAFSTNDLVTGKAVPICIPAGSSPVPVAVVDGGKLVLAGNSNRFGANRTTDSTLTVVDLSKIGGDANPVLGTIRCGAFPRNFYLTDDGRTLLLTNFLSGTLEIFDVSRLRTLIEK